MELEFLGFNISADSVSPSNSMLEAIRDFPRPTEITGVRSWFGLVNQVNYPFSSTDHMLPFRKLLKPGKLFEWGEDLEVSFRTSKEKILEDIKEGVKMFDPSLDTMLVTDWSRTGMGFSLVQKTCKCPEIKPEC